MRKLLTSFSIALIALFSFACGTPASSILASDSDFDSIIDGKPVRLYTLSNGDLTVQLCNYGGRIVNFVAPDRDGNPTVVVWPDYSIKDVVTSPYKYSGALVGRVVNRIGNNGLVTIEGKKFQLSLNGGDKHAHGGFKGFTTVVWDATQGINAAGDPTVTMKYLSPDGDEGYPGNLSVTVLFTLSKEELIIEYDATTDAPTIVNLTSHPFFNLHGVIDRSTNSHVVTLCADHYTPSGQNGLLLGDVEEVEGTPFDFRTPYALGLRVDGDDPQLLRCNGYDTNFLLSKPLDEYGLAATMFEPATGIKMEVYTDQPAIQLYGSYYQGRVTREQGINPNLPFRYGVALEAQKNPNAINLPAFHNTVLLPGDRYRQKTSYRFMVE